MLKKSGAIERIKKLRETIDRDFKGNPYEVINSIPNNEIWRFFVDGEAQAHGRLYNATMKEMKQSSLLVERFFNPSLFGISFSRLDEKAINSWAQNRNDPKSPVDPNRVTNVFWKALNYGVWGSVTPGRCCLTKEECELSIRQVIMKDCGWLPFEKREKNYLHSMINAFCELMKSPSASSGSLTLDFIKNLHKNALTSVEDTLYVKDKKSMPGQIRNSMVTAGFIVDGNATERCIRKMINDMEINSEQQKDSKRDNSDKLLLTLYVDGPLGNKTYGLNEKTIQDAKESLIEDQVFKECKSAKEIDFISIVMSNVRRIGTICVGGNVQNYKELIAEKLTELINQYNSKITTINDPLQKLDTILNFIQSCEQLHPFFDGNTRVFSMLLLNKLLMQNGLPPAVLYNPNRSTGYTIEELRNEVLDGMENTFNLIQNHTLYNVTTDEILKRLSQAEINYFNKTVSILEELKPKSTQLFKK